MGVDVSTRGRRCDRCGDLEFEPRAVEQQEREAASVIVERGIRTPGELKFVRKLIGLTPKELARLLDVHHKTVFRWEHRRAAPPRMVAFVLGELFTLPYTTRKKLEQTVDAVAAEPPRPARPRSAGRTTRGTPRASRPRRKR